MEKKRISLKTPENVTLMHGEQVIKVKPFLSMEEQVELTRYYIEQYFQPSPQVGTEKDYLAAEFTLMLNVIDKCTDIMLFENDLPVMVAEDFLSNEDLWIEIKQKITNFWDFYTRLGRIISDIKEENQMKASLGYVLDGLADRVEDAISSLMTFEPTEENMGKIKELVAQVNSSPILKGVSEVLNVSEEVKKPKAVSKKSAKSKKEKLH